MNNTSPSSSTIRTVIMSESSYRFGILLIQGEGATAREAWEDAAGGAERVRDYKRRMRDLVWVEVLTVEEVERFKEAAY